MGYQNFMRGMSNGGAVYGRNEALTDDALRARVPSIFAAEAHESRSARFAPVPTIDVLNWALADFCSTWTGCLKRSGVT